MFLSVARGNISVENVKLDSAVEMQHVTKQNVSSPFFYICLHNVSFLIKILISARRGE